MPREATGSSVSSQRATAFELRRCSDIRVPQRSLQKPRSLHTPPDPATSTTRPRCVTARHVFELWSVPMVDGEGSEQATRQRRSSSACASCTTSEPSTASRWYGWACTPARRCSARRLVRGNGQPRGPHFRRRLGRGGVGHRGHQGRRPARSTGWSYGSADAGHFAMSVSRSRCMRRSGWARAAPPACRSIRSAGWRSIPGTARAGSLTKASSTASARSNAPAPSLSTQPGIRLLITRPIELRTETRPLQRPRGPGSPAR